jgi:hypothetical protein
MKDKVDATLEERGNQYGDVEEQATVAESIKASMRRYPEHWEALSPVKKQSLDVIALKISRIICGNPLQPDSWHDIAGYAKLPHRNSSD